MNSFRPHNNKGYVQLTNLPSQNDGPYVMGIPVFFQQVSNINESQPIYGEMNSFVYQKEQFSEQSTQQTDGIESGKIPESKNYTTHKVERTDTLLGLSIQYGVSEFRIRQANDLHNDEIYYRKTLTIPNPNSNLQSLNVVDPEKLKQEQLCYFLKDKVLVGKDKNVRLAKIYLEAADWDLIQAEIDYKQDLASEQKPQRSQNISTSLNDFFKIQKFKNG